MTSRILIVEDDPAQRRILEELVKRFGFESIAADGGIKGLEVLNGPNGGSIELVILDLMMPGMDGLKLCSELRKSPAGSKLYFILLTPFEDERRKMEAYEAGVDEILRTPINTRLLAARLLAAQRIANPNITPLT